MSDSPDMSTHDGNPYDAPTAAVTDRIPPAKPGLRWKRIAMTILALWTASSVIGFVSGLTMAYPEWYGGSWESVEAAAVASENARWVRRFLIVLAYVPIYYLMLRPLASWRVVHALLVFVGVDLLDRVIGGLFFGGSMLDPITWIKAIYAIAPVLALAWVWIATRRNHEGAPRVAAASDPHSPP